MHSWDEMCIVSLLERYIRTVYFTPLKYQICKDFPNSCETVTFKHCGFFLLFIYRSILSSLRRLDLSNLWCIIIFETVIRRSNKWIIIARENVQPSPIWKLDGKNQTAFDFLLRWTATMCHQWWFGTRDKDTATLSTFLPPPLTELKSYMFSKPFSFMYIVLEFIYKIVKYRQRKIQTASCSLAKICSWRYLHDIAPCVYLAP